MPQPGYDVQQAARAYSHDPVQRSMVASRLALQHHHLEDAFLEGVAWARRQPVTFNQESGKITVMRPEVLDPPGPWWFRVKRAWERFWVEDAPPGFD